MAAPIPPSLSQLINPQAQSVRPAAPQTPGTGFRDAMAAQKSFFQQITTPKMTPATYTAADIARTQAQAAPAPAVHDTNQPLKRPGSFLNIVI